MHDRPLFIPLKTEFYDAFVAADHHSHSRGHVRPRRGDRPPGTGRLDHLRKEWASATPERRECIEAEADAITTAMRTP
jgi:hypothetical protein